MQLGSTNLSSNKHVRRFRAVLIYTIAAIILSATCNSKSSVAQPKEHNEGTASNDSVGQQRPIDILLPEEIAAKFQTPTTPLELLRNLKLALDQDWLLQPRFYDEDVLKKFFNGTKIQRIESIDGGVTGAVLGPLFSGIRFVASKALWRQNLQMSRPEEGSGAFGGQVQNVAGFTVDAVRSVFGDGSITYLPTPTPNAAAPQTTQDYSYVNFENAELGASKNPLARRKRARFEFSSNGDIAYFQLYEGNEVTRTFISRESASH